ncbi:MAG: ferrochelatase [Candidatus Kapaibacterium sp.]
MMQPDRLNILLINLGAPETPNEIRPFLRNLFCDPFIINIPGGKIFRPLLAEIISGARYKKSKKYYELIGGGSPLLEISRNQAAALEKLLSKHSNSSVRIGMRYSRPSIEDAIRGIPDGERLIVLPMYPQYSYTTTASSIAEFHRAMKKYDKSLNFSIIPDFRNHPAYLAACAGIINSHLCTSDLSNARKTALIFSAHSIPQKISDEGDPYLWQTRQSVSGIMQLLESPVEHYLSFQSKAGPSKWLEPDTEGLVAELGSHGCETMIMFPVSFTADNLETLYEMDILFKNIALKSGVKKFIRIPALNTDPLFIKCLYQIILSVWKKQ